MRDKLIYDSGFFRWLFHTLGKVYLKLSGWKVVGEVPTIPKFIVIAAPHTSNWDFPAFISIAGYFNMSIRFLGKHTLFTGPIGWLFYWLGGIPVERSGHKAAQIIDQTVSAFGDNDEFILCIAPEGTRSNVDKWKTGFYRIAVAAEVPILLAYLDSNTREIGFSHFHHPTGDMDKDMAEIQEFYASKAGIKVSLE